MESIVFTFSGQQRLMKALADIERGAGMNEDSNIGDSNKPMKAVLPLSKMVSTSSLAECEWMLALVQIIMFLLVLLQVRQEGSEALSIEFRLLSNWGHESCMGLTEIQIFDLGKHRMDLSDSQIEVEGAVSEKGQAALLFNGRCKVCRIAASLPLLQLYKCWYMYISPLDHKGKEHVELCLQPRIRGQTEIQPKPFKCCQRHLQTENMELQQEFECEFSFKHNKARQLFGKYSIHNSLHPLSIDAVKFTGFSLPGSVYGCPSCCHYCWKPSSV